MKLPSFLPVIGRRPQRVGVREAWLDPERYAGRIISLTGTVRAFAADTPTPYFTLDDGPQRIGLHADNALLGSFAGRAVRAIGTLTFKPGVGIFLEVEEIGAAKRR